MMLTKVHIPGRRMRAPQPTSPSPDPLMLVAGGSADMRSYLEGCLRALGPVRVVQAASGRATLHLARAFQPVLIIAEYTMPGLSSPVLYRALQADPRTCNIPVLFIGNGGPLVPVIGDGFLAKPFNAARLRAEAERLLNRPLTPHPPPP
ncbi:MAG: response regulator [Spiribacter salinus]|uniref:Response regulator n=1 Tax=Spiribacter salinus TaxID=1335746 RepID=A0A540V7S1_9GAMM|nr:MAG: response regulator [Spiribacter salinus]